MWRSLEYAIKESLTAIRRNVLMSLASIVTVAFSLGILGGFGLFTLGINKAAEAELDKFEITVWLNKEKSKSDISKLQREISSMEHVASVKYVPAEETWKKVKDKWGGVNLEGVDPSSFMGKLDHFRVRLEHPRYTAEAAKKLGALPNVAEVIEGQEVVEKFVGIADIIRIAGFASAVLLLLIAVFIISNTIRLMIYARRREIGIMQLVGATNWFIRLPLVFEGTALGVLGGMLACIMVLGGAHYVIVWVLKIVPSLGRFSSGISSLWVVGSLIGLGWVIGALGSLVSIQRFLKA